MITNADDTLLSTEEIVVLYRARWQIELLFKRWKSITQIADLSGKNDIVKMVQFWARLCGSLIQHWITVMAGWDPKTSLSFERIAKRVSGIAAAIIGALTGDGDLTQILTRFKKMAQRVCRRDSRSNTGTLELLRNPKKLDYVLS